MGRASEKAKEVNANNQVDFTNEMSMNRTGKKSRRFRFGFRTFFILFSVTCVGFGYFYQSTVPNKQARLFLERNSVMFDTSSSDTAWQFYSPYPINNQPFGTNTDIPAWQVALLGEDFFQPVVNITLVPPQIENQKFWLEFNKHRYGLRNVEKITIYGCFDDEALATIANLKGLKMLTFVQIRFSDSSYERLRELDQVDTWKIE